MSCRQRCATSCARHSAPIARRAWSDGLESRLRAYDRDRYREALAELRVLARLAPEVAAVRELYGLTLYRLGRWREAVRELRAFHDLTGSFDQHPVIADCERALGPDKAVLATWDALRQAGVDREVLVEGRLVVAGMLADRGELKEAIALLGARREVPPATRHLSPPPVVRPRRPLRAGGRPASGAGAVRTGRALFHRSCSTFRTGWPLFAEDVPSEPLGLRASDQRRKGSTVNAVDRVGLVGLPNSGKSSLFNALTGGNAIVAAHPFSTVETEVGVAHVPDPRVDALAKMSQSRKIVYAGFEVVDIAASGQGRREGRRPRRPFSCRGARSRRPVPGAAQLRGRERARRHRPLAALAVPRARARPGRRGDSRTTADKKAQPGRPPRPRHRGRAESRAGGLGGSRAGHALVPLGRARPRSGRRLKPFFLLTNKPTMAVINVGEDELADSEELVSAVAKELGQSVDVLAVSVQLEAEAARLDPARAV